VRGRARTRHRFAARGARVGGSNRSTMIGVGCTWRFRMSPGCTSGRDHHGHDRRRMRTSAAGGAGARIGRRSSSGSGSGSGSGRWGVTRAVIDSSERPGVLRRGAGSETPIMPRLASPAAVVIAVGGRRSAPPSALALPLPVGPALGGRLWRRWSALPLPVGSALGGRPCPRRSAPPSPVGPRPPPSATTWGLGRPPPSASALLGLPSPASRPGLRPPGSRSSVIGVPEPAGVIGPVPGSRTWISCRTGRW
jgi:hypothetical protein